MVFHLCIWSATERDEVTDEWVKSHKSHMLIDSVYMTHLGQKNLSRKADSCFRSWKGRTGSDVGFSHVGNSAVTAQLHKCTKSTSHTLRGMEKPGTVPSQRRFVCRRLQIQSSAPKEKGGRGSVWMLSYENSVSIKPQGIWFL